MPPYFSVTSMFRNNKITSDFINQLYCSVIEEGYPFLSTYDSSESFDKLINWNQRAFEFFLPKQLPYCYGFKQIMFAASSYSHMRGLFSLYQNHGIFTIIVPEYDVLKEECSLNFIDEKIAPLRQLAVRLWEKGIADVIQTHTEIDGPVNFDAVERGHFLMDIPFAIVHKDVLIKFPEEFFRWKECRVINSDGILIINQNPELFIEYWKSKHDVIF